MNHIRAGVGGDLLPGLSLAGRGIDPPDRGRSGARPLLSAVEVDPSTLRAPPQRAISRHHTQDWPRLAPGDRIERVVAGLGAASEEPGLRAASEEPASIGRDRAPIPDDRAAQSQRDAFRADRLALAAGDLQEMDSPFPTLLPFREDDSFPVGQPRRGADVSERAAAEQFRLARASGHERQALRPLPAASDARNHPLLVGGEGHSEAFSQTHRRRAVRLAEVDHWTAPAGLPDLVEEERAAIRRQIHRMREIQPGQLARGGLARGQPPQRKDHRMVSQQQTSVARHVVELQDPGHARHQTALAGQVHRV